MEKYQSDDKNWNFVFPLEEASLYIEYGDMQWQAKLSQIDRLDDFSKKCKGFSIWTWCSDESDIYFVEISMDSLVGSEELKIVFDEGLQKEFPCAFYNFDTDTYDGFSILPNTYSISVGAGTSGEMIVTAYDDEDIYGSGNNTGGYIGGTGTQSSVGGYRGSVGNQTSVGGYSGGANTQSSVSGYRGSVGTQSSVSGYSGSVGTQTSAADIKRLEAQLESSSRDNGDLRRKISELEAENRHLRDKVLNSSAGGNANCADCSKAKEAERLKDLVLQVVDKDFNGSYIKAADAEINEITDNMEKSKRLLKEKKDSIETLKKEYKDVEAEKKRISSEISETMDLLQKAESVKSESSTELAVFQRRLNDILNDLGMDIDTLKMYETQSGIDSLIVEAKEVQSKIESKLKALISSRQKDTDGRFKNISS